MNCETGPPESLVAFFFAIIDWKNFLLLTIKMFAPLPISNSSWSSSFGLSGRALKRELQPQAVGGIVPSNEGSSGDFHFLAIFPQKWKLLPINPVFQIR
jgi:hypothetical protein